MIKLETYHKKDSELRNPRTILPLENILNSKAVKIVVKCKISDRFNKTNIIVFIIMCKRLIHREVNLELAIRY